MSFVHHVFLVIFQVPADYLSKLDLFCKLHYSKMKYHNLIYFGKLLALLKHKII